MIFKFRNSQNEWGWISKVDDVDHLGIVEPEKVEGVLADNNYEGDIIHKSGNDFKNPPSIFLIHKGNTIEAYLINSTEVYLQSEETGQTLDTLR